MAITDWSIQERPREKLVLKGAENLSDAELLAIFIRTGLRGKTAIDLARDILQKFNGFRALIESDLDTFCKEKGLGLAKYSQLQAAAELGKRYLAERLQEKDLLVGAQDTEQFLIAQLRPYKHEIFACLFLDSQNQIISFDKMFEGTIDSAHVYPREVVKRALSRNAAAVIFAHNHPSGKVEPSQADKHITQQLQKALKLVDIRVLDHFIIGDNIALSFANEGLI